MAERSTSFPLRLYRVLLAAGGLLLVLVAVVYPFDPAPTIEPAAGRLALGVTAVALAGLTFVNGWVQRHAIGLVYGLFYIVSAWQIGLAALNALSPTSAFGLVLVFVGCSAGFQTFRALSAYSVLFVAAAAAVAYGLDDPLVPSGAFLSTVTALAVLGAYLFRMRFETLDRLEAARTEALAAAQAKSDFLATMRPESRTPLNGVVGMTDVLAGTHLDAEQRQALDTIRSSGEALLGVISDVLDFSKIEADRIDLEAQPVLIRDLVEDAVDVVAREAARRGVEVVAHVRPGVPSRLVGDATRLRQILLNLLSNAVKFTPAAEPGRAPSEVVLTLAAEPAAGGTVGLRASVRDTGIGIAPERLDRLFEPFTQADTSTTRRYGGTGLGLAISRRLAERMGGTLTATSQPGAGSTFTLTVRLAEAEPIATLGPVVPGRPSILILDDSVAACAALADLAREAGFEPHIERTPEGALAHLDGGGRYAVAIVDHDLDGVPGLEAVARLRAHKAGKGVPVAFLAPVGYAVPASRLVDVVLARPVRAARLREALARLVGARTPAVPVRRTEARLPRATDVPLRVLLAEDQPVNQRVALGLLRQLGLDADIVGTGRAAVEAVEAFAYDVVLMDVQMPEMDGLDATRAIRAGAGPQPVIVALTANAVAGDAEQCLAAGMDGYLSKPVRLDALRDALAAATGRTLAAPPRSAEALHTAPPRPAEALTSALPSVAHMLAHMRTLTDGDDPLADEILDAYLSNDLDLIGDLGHADRRASAAHKLKASSGTLGAAQIAVRATALEQSVRAGDASDAEARTLAADLRSFRRVVAEARAQISAGAPARRGAA